MEAPLHTQNPTGRFSSRASDYARFRPGYPEAALDAILEGLGPPQQLQAVDVGAGTGISSRWLAQRGVRTIAIEPNAAMREAASPHPLVEWRDGRAEEMGLDERCADLLISAQAFHWFEPQAALPEFARVLKPGRRLALVWNEGDRSDPLTAAYYQIVNEAAGGGGGGSVLTVRGAPKPFWESRLFSNQRELTFANRQEIDEDGLVRRAMSASYTPQEGPEARAVEAKLRAAFKEHSEGCAVRELIYRTRVFLAEKV